ncbi:MAG: DNA-processing protein DprA [bacterium]
MNSTSAELKALLRLSAVPGIGPNRIRSLVGHLKSAVRVLNASRTELTQVEGIDTKTAESILRSDGLTFADEQLRRMEKCGAHVVTFWDKEYPELLKRIYDPPAFLFVRGEFKSEDKYAIAVVGTRQPTNYGRIVAEKLTQELSQSGLTIVSGLAYGIDTNAHANALNNGGRTIAVLGSGVDNIYPAENTRLAEKIANGGAVISEYPMGAEPDRSNFPRRNRIICGLSLGVLIIEAGSKSGALITAMNALDQNREVFAVPGNIDSPKSIGTNDLIKQGAKCVMCVDDIIEELSVQLQPILENGTHDREPTHLTEGEKTIFEHLSHEPLHVDDIAKRSGLSTSKVLSLLLTLELKNVVRQLAGKMFVKI